ncbi:hypothetical protein VINE108521_13680 [Vibrio neonatus]
MVISITLLVLRLVQLAHYIKSASLVGKELRS